jgi:hypothetical protein
MISGPISVPIYIPYLYKNYFNIFLPFVSPFSKLLLSLNFIGENFVSTFHFPMCDGRPVFSILLDLLNLVSLDYV